YKIDLRALPKRRSSDLEHEGERGSGWEIEAQEDGQHDRSEEQRGAIIGEDSGDGCAEDDDQREEASPVSASPARDVERSPSKEAGLVEDEGDDDQRNESECGVPDDLPDGANVAEVNDTNEQRYGRPGKRRPPDTEPSRLPNDKDESGDEDREREHDSVRWESLDRALVHALGQLLGAFHALGVAVRQVGRSATHEICELRKILANIDDALIVGRRLHAPRFIELEEGVGDGGLVRDREHAHPPTE